MHGTREAIHRMKRRGRGHLVNVASMAGVVPIPGGATMGMIAKLTGLLPRRLGEAIMTASDSDHLLAGSFADAGRVAYEARVAVSAPGADRRGADTVGAPC